MLIIDTRESDSLDKALKKYKKKYEKSRILKELRGRQAFVKPSVRKRNVVLKAVMTQEYRKEHDL
ncbi:MAG TPA: 30S ribosomal protein S21 [Chitinophagales bacterium]